MKGRLLYLLLFLPFFTLGGGFELNTQGQKATGMAGAFSGVSSDASAVYFNPAAIVFHEKNMLNVGFNFMLLRTSFLSPSDGNVDAKSSLMFPFHIYATHHFTNKKFAISIGVYTPFGSSVNWNDKWTGRYLTQQTKFSTLFLQPTITYRMDDRYSIGLGIIGATGFLKIRKAILVNDDIEMDLKGTGYGTGFNAGLFAHYEKLNITINYRSSVGIKTNSAKAEFSNVPASLIDQQSYPESASGSFDFRLPSTFTIGAGYFPTERIIADLDISYQSWKDFTDWNTEVSDYSFLNSTTRRKSDNTFNIRLGGQYHWSDKMDYRLGVAYEESPNTEGNTYPDLTGAFKFVGGMGATRHIKESLSIDASFTMENYAENKETGNQQNFNGSYKKINYSLGLGLHYEF